MSQGAAQANYSLTNSSKTSLIFGGDYAASDEGSFFVATNATPGTAIATTTSVVDDATGATTHAQQKPVMAVQNQWPTTYSPSPMNIYPRYLKMVISQIPTGTSLWRYAMRLDPLPTKITTAGTVITPVSANSNSGIGSKAYITFGTITCTDSSSSPSQRLVANGQVTGAIAVANDEWIFTFGQGVDTIDSIGTQTLVKRLSVPVGPLIIAPGWTWTLEMWGASNSAAPSWEFEFGYIERPSGQ